MPSVIETNLKKENLRKIQSSSMTDKSKQLAMLKLAFNEDRDILTKYINNLVHMNRVFPRHLAHAQASARWSTVDPAITNWPRACIEPSCQERLRQEIYGQDHLGYIEHEWQDHCWSIRDILICEDDEVYIKFDHDDIEGRINAIITKDEPAMAAYAQGYDLHTITCCNIFGLPLPSNRKNPHTSEEDAAWRHEVKWQGKDTKIRVLSKNFNHGSKYSRTHMFVHRIKGIEQYGVSYASLEKLAKQFIKQKGEAWIRKLKIMDKIQYEQIARSLYGFRRKFYNSSEKTGREGYSHMVSSTVSHYNNETLIMLDTIFGNDIRLIHNAHDGDALALKKSRVEKDYTSLDDFKLHLRSIIERDITYQGRALTMTASLKVTVS